MVLDTKSATEKKCPRVEGWRSFQCSLRHYILAKKASLGKATDNFASIQQLDYNCPLKHKLNKETDTYTSSQISFRRIQTNPLFLWYSYMW